MFGAIIGDLAGSIYEYDQFNEVKPIKINKLIESNAFYSDDTILTMAILDVILNDKDYDKYLRKYIKDYSNYKPNFTTYFENSFSPATLKWGHSNYQGNSLGNGAMMRISPIGYLFDNEEEVIENAKLATIPSHNSKEAIDCATKIALMIFYFRKGLSKEEVYNKLNIIPKCLPFKKFNGTCKETIDNCLYVLYTSNSFEDALEKIISLGGDTDTNACIVGSVAQAMYGINDNLTSIALKRLPQEFVKILKKVEDVII